MRSFSASVRIFEQCQSRPFEKFIEYRSNRSNQLPMHRSIPLFLASLLWVVQTQAFDLENAEEIHEVCATCHGEYSQGGKRGVSPAWPACPRSTSNAS